MDDGVETATYNPRFSGHDRAEPHCAAADSSIDFWSKWPLACVPRTIAQRDGCMAQQQTAAMGRTMFGESEPLLSLFSLSLSVSPFSQWLPHTPEATWQHSAAATLGTRAAVTGTASI